MIVKLIFRPRIGLLGICLSGRGLPGCGLPGRGLFRRGLSGRGLSGRGLSGRGLPGCGLPGCYDFIIDFSHISDLFVVHVRYCFFYISDLDLAYLGVACLGVTFPGRGLDVALSGRGLPGRGVMTLELILPTFQTWGWPALAWPACDWPVSFHMSHLGVACRAWPSGAL